MVEDERRALLVHSFLMTSVMVVRVTVQFSVLSSQTYRLKFT